MNQVAWQIYGGSDKTPNTFIGGVASTINTPALLATKLGIDVSRITNFSIVGSDIKCRITGSYAIPNASFRNNTSITYFNDVEGLVTSLGYTCFYRAKSLIYVSFKNATSIGYQCFDGDTVYMELRYIYMPLLTTCGNTSGYDTVFRKCIDTIVYVNPSLATNNGGLPDGDLTNTTTQNLAVRYVSSFALPSAITNLSSLTSYNTAISLSFTPPSSANAIEFYDVYVNGILNSTHKSNPFAVGLSPSTSYNITVYVRDVYNNKSLVSNSISQSTTNYSYTDTDANAYISAATLTSSEQESAYQLITDLKTAGLWTKIQALYPFKGTTAAQHKFNAKNPLDTNAAFRLTFSGTGTYSNLGFQTNGSDSWANTYFAPSANQNVNSNGITAVVGTNNTVNNDNATLGSYNSESQMTVFTSKGSNSNFYRQSLINNRGSAIIQTGVNEARGIWTAMRTGATSGKMFRNNSLIGTGVGGGSLPNLNIYIGALNYIGSLNGVSHQRIQIVAFHEGLSDAEVATLHSIIDTSETIAGRKTW